MRNLDRDVFKPVWLGRGDMQLMKLCSLISIIVLLILLPFKVSAYEFTGESRTYLQFRETSDSEEVIPLYEYLSFNLDNIGGKEMGFYFGGWLKQDLAEESFGKRYNNDLQYAYFKFSDKERSGTLKLGRYYVFEGVAAEQVDGIYVKKYFWKRLGLSLYGGAPVETDSDERSGDYIYGGRLSYGVPGSYTMGFSYLKENNDSDDFREEGGIDILFQPVNKLELTGKSAYNIDTSGWQEHSYSLSIGPLAKLTIRPEVSWIDYKHYFTSVTTSAFDFTTTTIDPEDKVLILGGAVEYAFTGAVITTLDYKRHRYDIAGDADYYGGKIVYIARPSGYSMPKKGSFGLSLHRMDGETAELQYNEYRVFGSINFGKFDLSMDLMDVNYEQEINGVEHAYAAAMGLGYSLNKEVRAAADVEYSKNPEYDKEVKGLLKLIYNFSFSSGT